MDPTDFCALPVGDHEGVRIACCPKCGRHGRVQLRAGGGLIYDHLLRPLEPPVAGLHVEIVEWCDVPEPAGW